MSHELFGGKWQCSTIICTLVIFVEGLSQNLYHFSLSTAFAPPNASKAAHYAVSVCAANGHPLRCAQRRFYHWNWWNGGTQFDAAAACLQMSLLAVAVCSHAYWSVSLISCIKWISHNMVIHSRSRMHFPDDA